MTNSNVIIKQNTEQYNILKTLIEKFLTNLTVAFDSIEVEFGDLHTVFLIKSKDSGVLIGNNGENLRALNHLVKRMAEKNITDTEPQERMQFILDVNGYYSKRIEELRNQAKILAERAKMFKSNVEMNPMNAYERMIIHATFSNDSEIDTESEGFGKSRRVILKYKRKDPETKIEEKI